MAARQTVFDRKLTSLTDLAVSRIKVVESLIQKIIHHLGNLRLIDFFPDHRETHTSETKILFYLIHSVLLF